VDCKSGILDELAVEIRDKLTMMTRVVNCWPRASYSAASSVIFLSLLSPMAMWCDDGPRIRPQGYWKRTLMTARRSYKVHCCIL
jgi:hypothetical protein